MVRYKTLFREIYISIHEHNPILTEVIAIFTNLKSKYTDTPFLKHTPYCNTKTLNLKMKIVVRELKDLKENNKVYFLNTQHKQNKN